MVVEWACHSFDAAVSQRCQRSVYICDLEPNHAIRTWCPMILTIGKIKAQPNTTGVHHQIRFILAHDLKSEERNPKSLRLGEVCGGKGNEGRLFKHDLVSDSSRAS